MAVLPQPATVEMRATLTLGGTSHQPSSFYRPELDVLRFFAFFAVFLFHAYGKRVVQHAPPWIFLANRLSYAGVFGVDLFFALSAYLITELLLREKRQFGNLNVKAFYLRRILRIWPLYFFAIGLGLIQFLIAHDPLKWRYVTAFLLLGGNWSIVAWGWPDNILSPLWSVSVEEQFYLLWPPIVRKMSANGLAFVAVAMLVVSTVTRAAMVATHADPVAVWCNSLSRLDPIALGILVAVVLRGRIPDFSIGTRLGMLFGGVLPVVFVADFWHLPWAGSLKWLPYLLGFPAVAVGCALILLATLGISARARPAMVYLGKISYGLYVYHMLGIDLAKHIIQGHLIPRQTLALAITILLASVSYSLLEKPFLNLKKRFELVGSRPV